MSDPADLILTEAIDAVRERKLSSLELLDACFANIARVDKDTSATIWLDYEGACKSTRWADQAVKKRATLGPLHGMPMAQGHVLSQRQALHLRFAHS